MLFELIFAGLVAVGVYLSLAAALRHRKLRDIINKIPGYDGLPVLGDTLHLKSDTLGFYEQMYDLCRQNADKGLAKLWFGTDPLVWVFKADTVEALFNSSKHTKKSFTYWTLKPWLGEGLLLSWGDKWQARRRLITPTFHFKILEQFAGVFNEQAGVLVSLLDKKAGEPGFDIQPFIYRCMLDIICETAMGSKIGAQSNSDSKFVRAVYREGELTLSRLKNPWMWPDPIYRLLPEGKEHGSCLDELHGFTKQVIAERKVELESRAKDKANESSVSGAPTGVADDDANIYMGSKRRRLAFIDMLLETSATESSLNEVGIQEEVDTFMFEGHDTTASGAVWILYMLACYPELQVKVQQEIDSVFDESKREVTMEDANKLKYTDCFIKETFRLYPPVPWYGRTTTEPCTIGGYAVPEGVSVMVLTMQLHRDPERFPDPEKFDPDRWMEENAKMRHPYGYVPFSAGLRNCIGQKFAMLEEKVVLCHILRNFTVSTKGGRQDINPMATLILKPSVPLPLQFSRRSSSASK